MKLHEEFFPSYNTKSKRNWRQSSVRLFVTAATTSSLSISWIHATPDGPCSSFSRSLPVSQPSGTGGRCTAVVSPAEQSPRPETHRNSTAIIQGSCYGRWHHNKIYFLLDSVHTVGSKQLQLSRVCMLASGTPDSGFAPDRSHRIFPVVWLEKSTACLQGEVK
jgi:hypothetical protein